MYKMNKHDFKFMKACERVITDRYISQTYPVEVAYTMQALKDNDLQSLRAIWWDLLFPEDGVLDEKMFDGKFADTLNRMGDYFMTDMWLDWC